MKKHDLIKKYKKGELQDLGYYGIDNSSAIIVVDFNEEYVFGYYGYQDVKAFFKSKTKLLKEGFSFKVDRLTINSKNVMRIKA